MTQRSNVASDSSRKYTLGYAMTRRSIIRMSSTQSLEAYSRLATQEEDNSFSYPHRVVILTVEI